MNIKILFFIESLRLGGKERRMLEIIKHLSRDDRFSICLLLMNDDIAYKGVYDTNAKIVILKRKIKKDPFLFNSVYKVCKEFVPDIIHVWGNMPAFYAIPAKVALKITLINSQITDAPTKVFKGVLGPWAPFYFSNIILANSYAGLEAYDAPLQKSKVIYNGFDFVRLNNLCDPTNIRSKYEIPEKSLVIGMVATYSERKDHRTFVKSALDLVKERPDLCFVCAGDGDKTQLSGLIPEKYKKQILLLGGVEEIESLVNIFDIGVLCSYTEGISNSIMEYMALGKPVVYLGMGGTKELVEDSKSGFIIPPRDAEQLKKKLVYLISDKDAREKMGSRGKSIIHEKFSISRMVDEHIEVYMKASAK